MKIQCYLFDMNGTVRDDLLATYRSTNDVLGEFGMKPISMHTYRQTDETDFWQLYHSLGFKDSDRPGVGELFKKYFHARHESLVRAFPGVAGTVQELKRRGCVVGIVSNMRHERLDYHIEECGLTGLVDVRVGKGDTVEDKPSPQPLLEAFRRLGISPEHGSYTGDKVTDIEAAHAANTVAIAITHRGAYHTEKMLREAAPDRIIRKFSSLLYF
ncbi:MAG: HAD hydrolase-like protein [Candidatus Aenigmarchaeota archaeon]|nr:HAD hydrolase-like protein [Candidatus Aenigmarchaeota archaeon]